MVENSLISTISIIDSMAKAQPFYTFNQVDAILNQFMRDGDLSLLEPENVNGFKYWYCK